ncbi:MAG: hypothetical protein AB4060_10485 [Crocosphaera sp.]
MKSDLRKSLIVWGGNSGNSDPLETTKKVSNCRKLMDAFLEGKLPLDDYLGLIEAQGLDLDHYAETVSSNLRFFNLV